MFSLGYDGILHNIVTPFIGTPMTYSLIQVRTEADKVGVITLNRPKQLNALNGELMDELDELRKQPRRDA